MASPLGCGPSSREPDYFERQFSERTVFSSLVAGTRQPWFAVQVWTRELYPSRWAARRIAALTGLKAIRSLYEFCAGLPRNFWGDSATSFLFTVGSDLDALQGGANRFQAVIHRTNDLDPRLEPMM